MITIGGKTLTIDLFNKIVLHGATIAIAPNALKEVESCFEFLKSFSQNKLIYGINTGFGPMAQYRIDDKDRATLQFNLIRSHSSGMGSLLSPMQTRALMLARLNTLLLGFSGVHKDIITLLTTLINQEAYPCIWAHGGVGASGDLVQLAHLALGLIGEGKFWFKNKIVNALTVYKNLKIQPLKMHIREGLATLNGTSAMTGLGAINVISARQLVVWSTLLSLMINEMMEAYDDHLSEELNNAKLHQGQREIATWMRTLGKTSQLLRKRHEHLYEKKVTERVLEDKVQEYYSLRCVPQILGPILDTVIHSETVITNELNSVNDNPIIDKKSKNIYHGGNFHGDYVALEMDKLKIAVTKLSMLSERQLNFILNPALNGKLTPFVNAGKLGLNFGIQGMQYPATSTVAENQTMSMPNYIHSIPNNNDNQDIVSMGTNAALMCHHVVKNTYEVLAVELIALLQAIDMRGFSEQLSKPTKWLYTEARKIFPFIIEDIAPSEKMQLLVTWLKQTDIVAQHLS